MAVPGKTPPLGAVIVIERRSYFHGNLHLAGYAYAHQSPIREIAVRLGDGREIVLANSGLPSPELAGAFGAVAVAARFDEILPVGPDIVAVLQGTLIATATDGTAVARELSGQDASDITADLMARFKAMIASRPPGRMLEIGSRERTGRNYRELLPNGWDYLGLDIMEGPNVDLVGDAHEAGGFLPSNHFDAVMSFSVFEHLLMPWKAILELNKVMKPGAIGLILAPQTWPLHEEPWDYFRFSRHAWKGLLNSGTGFEIIDAADGGTAFIVPASLTAATAFGEWHKGAMMSAVLFRKVSETPLQWPVRMSDVVDDHYPA